MRIRVQFFAGAREILGLSVLEQELPDGATVQTLVDALNQAYPDLAAMAARFAVNRIYASPDTELHDGDEAACIPPVGGG